jgi:hypothetical protein
MSLIKSFDEEMPWKLIWVVVEAVWEPGVG